jgi:hypothetical protein
MTSWPFGKCEFGRMFVLRLSHMAFAILLAYLGGSSSCTRDQRPLDDRIRDAVTRRLNQMAGSARLELAIFTDNPIAYGPDLVSSAIR